MVRGTAEISAGGPADFGAVDGREQPQDVQEDAEELAVEKACPGVTVEHQPKEVELALVVGDLGVVHPATTALSAPLVERESHRKVEGSAGTR